MKHIYAGLTPDSLEDGRPIGHGDVVDLSPAQVKENARLIDAELLRPVRKITRKENQ